MHLKKSEQVERYSPPCSCCFCKHNRNHSEAERLKEIERLKKLDALESEIEDEIHSYFERDEPVWFKVIFKFFILLVVLLVLAYHVPPYWYSP